ncbi:hypothetical protein ADK75_36345 [Streptomyces virginiae]|uniref:P/Homo B domain-containing protein n=1 Tax=Streptomyces virginiae TaxID=1961 RepID=A0A0L8M1L8_STRVG|nr:proprotein convertase P-domain-containing protein [Streptomyces virginiae]KOG44317.1 hypothetical protein ADK75_36345 [Streptomyces virginiae]
MTMRVTIRHSWRGDLTVDLVAPDGTYYRLKDSSYWNWSDDVVDTYTVNTSAKSANGLWMLRVQDATKNDSGYIDTFRLAF